jgi:CRISPR system Cascade subunit CasD
MAIVALRLAAPLMSWGDHAKYRERQTRPDPTYSALVGLLSAAAGIGRGAVLPSWLREVGLAVRVDAPGTVLRDYHTVNPPDERRYQWLSDKDRQRVGTVAKAEVRTSGDPVPHTDPVVTERFYRQDAAYLVVVNDPTGRIEAAFTDPAFAFYAGRKSCPLTFPVVVGRLDHDDLETALGQLPRLRPGTVALDAILFSPPNQLSVRRTEIVHDEPVGGSFAPRARFYVTVQPADPEPESTAP